MSHRTPEWVRLLGPLVDTLPVYEVYHAAVSMDLEPEDRAFLLLKLKRAVYDMRTCARSIDQGLKEYKAKKKTR